MSPQTRLVLSTPAITTKPDKECNAKEVSASNLRASEAEPSSSNLSSEKSSSVQNPTAEILSQEHLGFDCADNVPQTSFGNSSNRNSHASSSTAAVSPMDVAPTALATAPEEFAQTFQESQDLEAKAWYERLIVQQQDPRPLKSTDAEYVELM
jgi:hypothetical protein